MFEMIATVIEEIAKAGAGFLCYGSIYEPEVPEELQEK